MYSVGNYIMENEIWKDIPEYVGYYQSNQNGDIKSLQRITIYNDGRKKVQKEKILKHYNRGKYKKVDLCKHGVVKKHYVHLLVFFSFNVVVKKKNYVVDHINNDKSDNRICNLQYISQRENTSKDNKNKNHPCVRFVGQKWQLRMKINGENVYIGSFNTKEKAIKSYKNKILMLNK